MGWVIVSKRHKDQKKKKYLNPNCQRKKIRGKREMKGRTRASPVAKWLKEKTETQEKIKQSSS